MDKVQTPWQVDWRRVGEYLLGRSTLIGIASLMLLLISGYATWHGMRDFIIGVSGSAGHDSGSGLSIPNDLLVVIVVVALTFLMWLALRETFGAHRRLTERLITIPLYLFLALWSIGFGYGFWWSLLRLGRVSRSSQRLADGSRGNDARLSPTGPTTSAGVAHREGTAAGWVQRRGMAPGALAMRRDPLSPDTGPPFPPRSGQRCGAHRQRSTLSLARRQQCPENWSEAARGVAYAWSP